MIVYPDRGFMAPAGRSDLSEPGTQEPVARPVGRHIAKPARKAWAKQRDRPTPSPFLSRGLPQIAPPPPSFLATCRPSNNGAASNRPNHHCESAAARITTTVPQP